jgi:GH43 family beta-xylosidase
LLQFIAEAVGVVLGRPERDAPFAFADFLRGHPVGGLIADETTDVLDPKSWKQHPAPVLERNDVNDGFGPGHNGFFRSPHGREDWIVYHAKTASNYAYRGRPTRLQKPDWNADGTPNFGEPLPLDKS